MSTSLVIVLLIAFAPLFFVVNRILKKILLKIEHCVDKIDPDKIMNMED